MHWPTSARLMKCSTARSQTARPSRFANGFFSLSLKRDERPAAGKITAKVAMARLLRRLSYGAADPLCQSQTQAFRAVHEAVQRCLDGLAHLFAERRGRVERAQALGDYAGQGRLRLRGR